MTKLAYFPPIESADELTDVVSRAGWFLTFSEIERIYVPISDPALAHVPWKVAPGMDPAIAERFDVLRARLTFVTVRQESDLAPVIDEVSDVLVWNQATVPAWLPRETVDAWLLEKRVHEVDPDAIRQEGGNYIDVGFKLMADVDSVIADARARFKESAERLGTYENAVIVATGPSAQRYAEFDYADTLGIVCNTAILDEELMKAVQPKFVVFADPIFHFGPSRFAARFRARLKEVANDYDFQVVIPLKYHAVFAAAVPELAARTVSLPFTAEREFNFDLRSDFELRTTANVLTFIMIPLATTFATNVGVLGCDGRALDEDTHFWRHNPRTQFTDELENIREVHPGFFAIDYNDYYLEHCEKLEEQLSAGERAGRGFSSLADSHIPALKRRAVNTGKALNGRRLLVIDPTRVGGMNATGQQKRNLLQRWSGPFLQAWAPEGDNSLMLSPSLDPSDTDVDVTDAEALEQIAAFNPDVVYYRPVLDSHPRLHELALEVLDRNPVPLVTHIVDDWPSRFAAKDAAGAAAADQELRQIFARSDKVLGISERMAAVFQERYGLTFEPIANGVDVGLWLDASKAAKPEKAAREELVLRYCGALAKDMTFDTILNVAKAVDSLQGELSVRFEIFTMPAWRTRFRQALSGLRGTDLFDVVPDEDYPELLSGSDVLVFGYNFDPDSLRYIALSMPNKLPEYLASGAAVLAVGPAEANGIDYVASAGIASCVTAPGPEPVEAAIRRLADRSHRDELAARAQAWAFEKLNLRLISGRFQEVLDEAAAQWDPLVGPYRREDEARLDESHVVAKLLEGRNGAESVMLDVGAHHGSSLAPFAGKGWKVIACEPDAQNRAKLEKRYGQRPNVTIDPRAVSSEPAAEAAFFSSEESTGISGLHAFRETHRQSDSVEVTTVAELCERHSLDRVDYLKIDVEGFDWDVVKGVPWERIAPDVIECEFEDAKTVSLGHTYRDVADYLVERGYSVYLSEWHPIIRYGISHQWRTLLRYPTRLASAEGWGNILAFRDDPGTPALTTALRKTLEVGPAETKVPIANALSSPGSPGTIVSSDARSPKRRMTRGGSRYERFYIRVRDRSPAVFAVARVATWCARKARRYPALTLAYLALIAGLVAGAFALEFDPYGAALLGVAGLAVVAGMLLVAVGFSRFLIKEVHHDLSIKHLNLRRRVEKTEAVQRREPAARSKVEKRLGSLDSDVAGLRSKLDGEIARTGKIQADFEAGIERERDVVLGVLRDRLADLLDAQAAMRDSLVAEVAALRSGGGSSLGEASHDSPVLVEEVEGLRSQHKTLADKVAALRSDRDSSGLEEAFERLRSEHDSLAAELAATKSDLGSIASLQAELDRMEAAHAALQAEMSGIRSRQSVGEAVEMAIEHLSSAQEATQAALIAEIRTREQARHGDEFEARFNPNHSPVADPSRPNP